jgi:hypothetical protein
MSDSPGVDRAGDTVYRERRGRRTRVARSGGVADRERDRLTGSPAAAPGKHRLFLPRNGSGSSPSWSRPPRVASR